MDYFTLIQNAVDRIEAHLNDELQVSDLARSAYCSDAHFSRVFRDIVGVSVMAYVRGRRLSLAGRALMLTQEKILDIALAHGYETPEAFTKAFKRFHGLSPAACRKNGTVRYMERSFPLVTQLKIDIFRNSESAHERRTGACDLSRAGGNFGSCPNKGAIHMTNFGSALHPILDDLDKQSAHLYLCFNAGGERFAVPALQVNEIGNTRCLHINNEGKLYVAMRGFTLPAIHLGGTTDITEGQQNVLICIHRPARDMSLTQDNSFGLVIDSYPELKIAKALNASNQATNLQHPFITHIGQFEDEETPIVQAEYLRQALSDRFATQFAPSDTPPAWHAPQQDSALVRLEYAAYDAALLARNASIEAARGMAHHKGTMVVAYELHQHAVELANIAKALRS